MQLAIALNGWQLSIILAHAEKALPDIKIPTLAEIKEMKKAAYRRFREALKGGGKSDKGNKA